MRKSQAFETPRTQITELIDALCTKLSDFGLYFRGYTSLSVSTYCNLPPVGRKQISDALSFALALMNSAPKNMAYSTLDAFLIGKACQSLNLRLPENFTKSIQSGDIVEIYDLVTQTQVYRNFEFLRNSSYDLLTVCVTPYPELFAREEGFEEKILERTREITLNGHNTEPWNVPNHHLVEKLDGRHRKFFLKLGLIAPVYNSNTGERVAWASTIQVVSLGSAYPTPNVVQL